MKRLPSGGVQKDVLGQKMAAASVCVEEKSFQFRPDASPGIPFIVYGCISINFTAT